MVQNFGIIYKITNLVNDKIYIGKTKQYYGKEMSKREIEDRFRRHKRDALNHEDNCPLLCRAMRKYGTENFVIEQVTKCTLEMTADLEQAFISYFNSRDKKVGYNITGGGGYSDCKMPEETRKKISETQGGDLNVHKIYRKGKHIGYRSQRKQDGGHFYKTFANTKFSLEENYQKAQDWIQALKDGTLENKKYVKETGLPINITYKRVKGEIQGYRVNIRINTILYSKDFKSCKMTMEAKLEQAKEWKKMILSKND